MNPPAGDSHHDRSDALPERSPRILLAESRTAELSWTLPPLATLPSVAAAPSRYLVKNGSRMAGSSGSRSGPKGDGRKRVEIDRRYWRDLRYGDVWVVKTQAQRDPSRSEDPSNDASVVVVFDSPDLHHVVRWSDPKPLAEVSNEALQDLLNEARKGAPPRRTPRPRARPPQERLSVDAIREPEPQPRAHVAGLQVYGSDVSRDLLETLSVQLGLFLEELDRAESGADSPRFDWRTADPSFRGNRVLVAPTALPTGSPARSADPILERARRGISMLYGRPVRPPGFTEESLTYLAWMASAFESPGVARLVFFAVGRTAVVSHATLENLRACIDSTEAWDADVG